MFPKFVRVVSAYGQKMPAWINETTFTEETIPFTIDKLYLDVLTDALGFSYEVVHPNNEEGAGDILPNGSWTGALGMIQRSEADLAFRGVSLDEVTQEAFRMSYPFTVLEITFMTRKHGYVPDTGVFLHPFSIPVWFSITACVCLMTFIFNHLMKKKYTAVSRFMSVMGSLVGQGMSFTPRKPREYVVLAFWILSSALLYYFYAAVLLSFITFPSLRGIRTIEDLASGIKNGEYQCGTFPFADLRSVLAESADESFRVIGLDLNQNEGVYNPIEFLEKFAGKKKPVFIGPREEFIPYKDFYFVSEDNFHIAESAFAVEREFCCGSELDEIAHRGWASGIFQKIANDANVKYFLSDLKEYGRYWGSPPTESPLTLTMLRGPFLFLITFLSLSFLLFLIELCIGQFNRRRTKNRCLIALPKGTRKKRKEKK